MAPDARTDPLVSPDGRTVAVLPSYGEDTGTILLFDASTGRRLRGLRVDGVFDAAAFSPDSTTLAVLQVVLSQPGSQVVMRDVATGSPRATLSIPYVAAAHGLAFVRGGAWLVTTESGVVPEVSSTSTRIDLWDAATLQPIGESITIPPDAAFLSPNRGGDKLGTGADADNGLSLVWNMDPASWEATACQIAGRNLSHVEWNEYLAGHPYRVTCPQWAVGA
jgi:hypothetical protein